MEPKNSFLVHSSPVNTSESSKTGVSLPLLRLDAGFDAEMQNNILKSRNFAHRQLFHTVGAYGTVRQHLSQT